jgi:UDP-N-acetylglucosamine acyltransferase
MYRILFQENRNTSMALELIESAFDETIERNNILSFVKNSKRGIIKGFNGNFRV